LVLHANNKKKKKKNVTDRKLQITVNKSVQQIRNMAIGTKKKMEISNHIDDGIGENHHLAILCYGDEI